MSATERAELMTHIRQYLVSGRLTEQLFGDMVLLYASLLDPSLLNVIDSNQDGESFARLKRYEGDDPGKGWPEVHDQVGPEIWAQVHQS